MKRIEKERVVKTYIYESVDGKQFETEDACKEWEKSYESTMEASWQKFDKEIVATNDFGIAWGTDDDEAYLICPKSMDDVVFLNAYVDAIRADCCNKLTKDSINRFYVLNFGYGRDFADFVDVEKHFELLVKNFNIYKDNLNKTIERRKS